MFFREIIVLFCKSVFPNETFSSFTNYYIPEELCILSLSLILRTIILGENAKLFKKTIILHTNISHFSRFFLSWHPFIGL